MGSRKFWPVVALLTIALAGCGWTDQTPGPREPGCTVPEDEDALLDAYANDPVLAVRPAGARPVGDVARTTGCHRLNKEDVSVTSVSLSWRPDHDYDDATLRETFDPVARYGGWSAVVDPDLPADTPGELNLTYCRTVRGVPSRLQIHSQATQRQDVRPSSTDRPASPQWMVIAPALIRLDIYPYPACPKP
ncbi:hypothetical protein GA0074695_5350 [Micromonospora viridifaciens]|uniref:Uncharacterized protein n=1 Tax=Micromonospora viridifaciens TaxID=1881 RepID=A0A1C4ZBA2_MICVI|nr:hypothetical protein [Micromonospora viridifaciens]SCF30227.1 hypothetical protein GA0074695_5350 [Micromonospora viridifaciens]